MDYENEINNLDDIVDNNEKLKLIKIINEKIDKELNKLEKYKDKEYIQDIDIEDEVDLNQIYSKFMEGNLEEKMKYYTLYCKLISRIEKDLFK